MGFTESQQKMFYFSLGDIFAELGGLSASVNLVIGATATLMVLRYVFDLNYVIQRKSAHKFRLLTIDKYQKCLPQIKLIIATIPCDHPDYKEYMEDKASIKEIATTEIKTFKESTRRYDILRYLINKYSTQHNIVIPHD